MPQLCGFGRGEGRGVVPTPADARSPLLPRADAQHCCGAGGHTRLAKPFRNCLRKEDGQVDPACAHRSPTGRHRHHGKFAQVLDMRGHTSGRSCHRGTQKAIEIAAAPVFPCSDHPVG